MRRADEMELVRASPVGQAALVVRDPELPDSWWAALNASLDALASQRTPRVGTPDIQTATQEPVTATIRETFPEVPDTRVDEWFAAHAGMTWANVTGPDVCIIGWEDWGGAPRGSDAATLWGNPLAVPAPAEQVWRNRSGGTSLARASAGPGVQIRPTDGAVLLLEGRRAACAPGGSPAGPRPEGSRAAHH
ncbi:hypothetical protein AB0C96_32310 [Streptomyces sp. NPDC048506]|uniref:hypothetical protein n=1 Tax=Streptomyces sp. NPDC048506 TaxID=3155028 RepID=UPI00342D2DFF